jgi:hypothetical protein
VFDLSLYNDEFFEWHLKHAREYSIKTMDWYIDKYKPMSVIDFGCGIGSYLESAYNHDLYIRGFEISEAARKYTPEHIQKSIFYFDCTQPLFCTGFDTVLSFETAEHIDPDGTQQFVNNIMLCVGMHLLFTAAPPGQQGTGHINLQPRQFWIDKFSEMLKYDNELTKDISENWRELGAPNYICDNLIVCTR